MEFDPDEKTVEKDFDDGSSRQLQNRSDQKGEDIAYLGEIVSQEEEAFKKLLKDKFALFRSLLEVVIEHPYPKAMITIEQAKRIAKYTQETFFRHLRLYDFVLKNTKLSEVKRVYIPVAEPKCGDDLNKAIYLFDSDKDREE